MTCFEKSSWAWRPPCCRIVKKNVIHNRLLLLKCAGVCQMFYPVLCSMNQSFLCTACRFLSEWNDDAFPFLLWWQLMLVPLCAFVFFRYLNAIQTMCPHILRYLTTAVITNKDVRKRRQVLKDLVKVIQQVRSKPLSGTIFFILNLTWLKDSGLKWVVLLSRLAGVVHVQGPNHGVCGVSLLQLPLWQRPEEAEGMRVGKDGFLKFASVCLSQCKGHQSELSPGTWHSFP